MLLCSCGKTAQLVSGKEIYPHRKDLYSLSFWLCKDCNAYCGCHKGTTTPLGTLANPELRELRKKCHAEFDPIWKNYSVSRNVAYKWMMSVMQLPSKSCHIAMFDVEQCKKLLAEICQGWEQNTLPFLLSEKLKSYIELGDFLQFYGEYHTRVTNKPAIPNKSFNKLTKKELRILIILEFDTREEFANFESKVFYFKETV